MRLKIKSATGQSTLGIAILLVTLAAIRLTAQTVDLFRISSIYWKQVHVIFIKFACMLGTLIFSMTDALLILTGFYVIGVFIGTIKGKKNFIEIEIDRKGILMYFKIN